MDCHILLFVSVLFSFVIGSSALYEECEANKESGTRNLARFGYLPEIFHQSVTNCTEDFVVNATKCYQACFNLTVTGLLDAPTLGQMGQPRCGCKDDPDCSPFFPALKKRKRRDYTFFGPTNGWNTCEIPLTWNVYITNVPISPSPTTQYTAGVTDADVEGDIARAFQTWADAIDPPCLTFTKVSTSYADLEFIWTVDADDVSPGHNYFHDDASRPDDERFCDAGQDVTTCGVLAHAYHPWDINLLFPASIQKTLHGDNHYNNRYTWKSDCSGGINIYQVVLHEIGHALGLGHCETNQNSIMYPSIGACNDNFPLDAVDIAGINAVYASVPRPVTTTPAPPPPAPTTTPAPPPPAPTTTPTSTTKYFPDCAYKRTAGVKGTSTDCHTYPDFIACQNACYFNPTCASNGFSWMAGSGMCCLETESTVNTVQAISTWALFTAVCNTCDNLLFT